MIPAIPILLAIVITAIAGNHNLDSIRIVTAAGIPLVQYGSSRINLSYQADCYMHNCWFLTKDSSIVFVISSLLWETIDVKNEREAIFVIPGSVWV